MNTNEHVSAERRHGEDVPRASLNDFSARVKGCWMGKSIGGTLGLPAEGKMTRLNYTFYEPIPTSAPPNDDLELQLVWLHLVENSGSSLVAADFARAWIEHIHYMWDEYGRCRWNLRRGVPAESAGTFENPFHAGMGSPIRSEIWACLFPGDLESSAHYAALDASIDHGPEGVAGEVLFAVMQSGVIVGESLEPSIKRALKFLPSASETARAVEFVLRNHASGMSDWQCWESLLARFGNENFTHAPLNVALTIWALLYGGGDFEKSILLAVNGGYDTDCTAASVGATLGLLLGEGGIPFRWMEPIGEGVYVGPGIKGISAPTTLGELSQRVEALVGKLTKKKWSADFWSSSLGVNLIDLPGTIEVFPLGMDFSVPWANGELPREVKSAGGATWSWEVSTCETRGLICLARQGARMYLNGALISECPAGLPYVPAPHRDSAFEVRVQVNPGVGTHSVRVELDDKNAEQQACVILVYPNSHIAPWTASELPDYAFLPA